jgi:hypothetical protein
MRRSNSTTETKPRTTLDDNRNKRRHNIHPNGTNLEHHRLALQVYIVTQEYFAVNKAVIGRTKHQAPSSDRIQPTKRIKPNKSLTVSWYCLAIKMSAVKCCSPGCVNPVTGNLACPVCKGLGLTNFFCGQDCFKKNYATHKQVHAIAKQVIATGGYVLSVDAVLVVVALRFSSLCGTNRSPFFLTHHCFVILVMLSTI